MKKVFSNKLFLATFISDLISNFGDVVYYMALLNYVLLIPESNVAISIITMVEIIPIILAVVIGYFADKTVNKLSVIKKTLIIRTILFVVIGLFMKFTPSLWIVILAIVIRTISSIIGNYENSLYIPIHKHIIPDENREEIFGFSYSIGGAFSLLFNMIGGVLILVMSYSNLAFLDAATFLISFLIITKISHKILEVLPKKEIEENNNEKKLEKINLKKMINEVKEAIKCLVEVEDIRTSVLLMPIVKGFFVTSIPIVLMIIKDDPNFVIIESKLTISILLIVGTVGTILGGFFTMNLLRKIKIYTTLKVVIILITMMLFFMYIHNIYLVILFAFLIDVLLGALNPKLNAEMINKLPEEKIGTIFGGLVTYISLGDLVLRTLFSAIILFLNTSQLILVFLGLYAIISIYVIIKRVKTI